MANYRRKRPKEQVVQRNGDWSHPPLEKGRYKYSTVGNKRRMLASDPTPMKRISTYEYGVDGSYDISYIYDWEEI